MKRQWRPTKNIRRLSLKDVEDIWQQNGINVKGEKVPFPIQTFNDMRIPIPIIEVLGVLGFVNPLPIQKQVIPSVYITIQFRLFSRNTISIAEIGKTTCIILLSILLSLDMEMRMNLTYCEGPIAVIILPCKEMVFSATNKIKKICDDISNKGYIAIKIVQCVGGESVQQQIQAIKRGVHILVATPGRLAHLLQKSIDLSQCEIFCMESNRLTELDFQQDIDFVFKKLPPKSVKALFFSQKSQSIGRFIQFLDNPLIIETHSDLKPLSKQTIKRVPKQQKLFSFLSIMNTLPIGLKMIVLCQTRQQCQDIAFHLKQIFKNVTFVKNQQGKFFENSDTKSFRQQFNIFYTDSSGIFVTTELIDVDNITTIVNYGLPRKKLNLRSREQVMIFTIAQQ